MPLNRGGPPTCSVKPLTMIQGFRCRATNPSGMASVEWVNDYCRTKYPVTLQHILGYNEDDCIAMRTFRDRLV